jgi:hypothetical protein
LTSVALDCAGYDVLATDKRVVLDLLRLNVCEWQKRKLSQSNIIVEEFDWFSSGSVDYVSLMEFPRPRFPDLIVCSDCIYSSSSVLPLLSVLEKVPCFDFNEHV